MKASTESGRPVPAAPTTLDQTVVPQPLPADGPTLFPYEIARYAENGYGRWEHGPGLEPVRRLDLMPAEYEEAAPADQAGAAPAVPVRLLRFFTISDIHITDVQSPAQAIRFGYKGGLSSAYSGVMLYTHHVLDAAVRTANALHAQEPFDFGLSLGDTCNNTQYNELRWYIDVLDGGLIDPDSSAAAHTDVLGDDPAPLGDYLESYKATGLDPAIPWYQVRGNHDHFWMGFMAVDDYLRDSYVGETILNLGDVLKDPRGAATRGFYTGSLDGRTQYGDIYGLGAVEEFAAPPKVSAANPDRHSVTLTEWMEQFFVTTSHPRGHGFTTDNLAQGHACYSFEPKSDVPVRILVLDDTQRDDEPNHRGYGHASLDQARWDWLVRELDRGQADCMLMIIAAHVPIAVEPAGSPMTWSTAACVTEEQLFAKLHSYPNLILFAAGHRHRNTITALPSPDPARPELGFWEVETASLRDFPQQLRTFDLVWNGDETVSIVATNVDTVIEEGTPAATSRAYAVAAQQIFENPIGLPPSGSCNAELLVPLSSEMRDLLAGR